MKNVVLRYGIVSGCVLIFTGIMNWLFVAKQFGYTPSEVVGYASFFIALMAVPLGIKYYKENLNNGFITMKDSFKIGLGITGIASLVMFFYSLIYFKVFGDEFMEWYESSVSVEEWKNIESQMASMPDYMMTPWFRSLVMLITVFFIGFIITLISSLVIPKLRSR